MGIAEVGIDVVIDEVGIDEVGINPYKYACLSHTHLHNYTSKLCQFYRVDWVSKKGPKDIHIFWGEDGELVLGGWMCA